MNIEDAKVTNEAIKKIEDEMKENYKTITTCRNKDYVLTNKLNELKMNECRKRIGKCFIKGEMVYRIIGISELQHDYRGPSSFNEFIYSVLTFKYPFNNSLNPFETDEINLCPSLITQYEEIPKEVFNQMFLDVNEQWVQLLA